MSEAEYCDQLLTPHGQSIIPLMGAYYRNDLVDKGLDLSSTCDDVIAYADNSSTRCTQTANLLLKGMNCPSDVKAVEVGDSNLYTELFPVVSDHENQQDCPVGTEEQVNGLYGGDISALNNFWSSGLDLATSTLNMTTTFPYQQICGDVNPLYNSATTICTLSETGYKWTGVYYEGMFNSPLTYGAYFAATWMLQYVSNLDMTKVAFGSLSLEQISALYAMNTANLFYGSNIWTSKAYASQQLGYIAASLKQAATGKPLSGVQQPPDKKLLLLTSHDFNQFYLQRLLNLNWIPDGNPQNVATTGGSLSFELWRDPNTNDPYVKVVYTSATPDQQRNATVLSSATPPAKADIVIPACGALYCPLDTFVQISIDAIDKNCVNQPLADTLSSLDGTDSDSGDPDMIDVWYGQALIATWVVAGLGGLIWVTRYIFASRGDDEKTLIGENDQKNGSQL
jgi:hypothetical protein